MGFQILREIPTFHLNVFHYICTFLKMCLKHAGMNNLDRQILGKNTDNYIVISAILCSRYSRLMRECYRNLMVTLGLERESEVRSSLLALMTQIKGFRLIVIVKKKKKSINTHQI